MPDSVTLWTIAHQAPLSMGFSRQEHWSGLHVLLQRISPAQGSNPHPLHLLHWQEGTLPLEPPGKTSIFYKSNLAVMSSLSFCLSGRVFLFFISGQLCCIEYFGLANLFFFSTLNISSLSFLACQVSAEKITDSFMGVPL